VRATPIPASCAATSSSRTARHSRPNRLCIRFASTNRVTAAAAIASHACQRSGATHAGAGSTATGRPWSPWNTPSAIVVTAGTTIVTASVTPARYGPRRRAAATPTTAPASVVTRTAATTDSSRGVPVGSSATVYAPVAISAPCPSDTWPLTPISRVSPAVAHRYAAAVASW
jgi:ribosomal protein L27